MFLISAIRAILIAGACAAAPLDQVILGGWLYWGYEYEGHRQEKTNPNLIVRFEFAADGTARVFWSGNNHPGFCERLEDYHINGDTLYQKVTWLNPGNDPACSRDPDMRLGQEMLNRIRIQDDELHIYLLLHGVDFIYITKRIPSTNGAAP